MQKIKKLYRSMYAGERVITELVHEEQEWRPQIEWVPNAVFNDKITTQALAIGNGTSRLEFNLDLIKNHKGGLLGSERLQTYGCNALYRDFAPDFLIAIGDEVVNEIAGTSYANEHVVYTNGFNVMRYPSQFYLIPQDPNWNAGAIAAYMACFDGHKKVYLLGFDGYDVDGMNNAYVGTPGYPTASDVQSENFWVGCMNQLFHTYPDVDFVRVAPVKTWHFPEGWKYIPNVRQISFREFVAEADI